MCSPRGRVSRRSPRVPYEVLLQTNHRLLKEKVELTEEIGQLRAAVAIFRELAARPHREKPPSEFNAIGP